VGDPVVSAFAASAVEEGIWTWIERMEGEVLPEAAKLAMAEDAEAAAIDRLLTEPLGAIDVPLDYYDDPTGALAYDPLHLDQIDLSEFDLPIVMHERVLDRMRLFVGPQRKYFRVWLQRKARYQAMIDKEITAAGLPHDLIYLSMIESGFNTYAYSHAAAAGLWQFIPSTGRMYKLRVDWWVDERRDPEKATKASLKMLSELHDQFGDWHLAFAAYNTGPGRVRRAIKRARGEEGSITYWDLVEQDLLHPETKGYVPKIVAAAIIAKHPERYGFTDLELEAPLVYESVSVEGPVELAVLAKCAGMDEETFKALNPALRRYATPEGDTDVRVPVGNHDSFVAAYAKVPPGERITIVRHKIRPGETLSTIGEKYGVSAGAIANASGISNPNRISAGQWVVIPMRGDVPVPPTQAVVQSTRPATPVRKVTSSASGSSGSAAKGTQRYTVRSGDTVSQLAERFDVPSKQLMSDNGIRDARSLRVGQRLTIRGGAPAATATSPTGRYTVQSGDTMSGIASKHGVAVADLLAWNGMSDPRGLQAGQVLKLKTSTSAFTHYTVKSGDTLGAIAQRHEVSVSDLRSWNGLSGNTIYVGQRLKLKARK
jgi:membrane-bound lytic murein transglycosylase D